jgi:hypothetical protein
MENNNLTPPKPISLSSAFWYWLKLGFISFGGPACRTNRNYASGFGGEKTLDFRTAIIDATAFHCWWWP